MPCLGGLSAVHQFVRIGRHAMIGGMSGVERDVIPYGQVMGDRARLSGLNIIGMQRRGFSREDIQALRSAYQFLFSADGTFNDRVTEMAERFGGIAPVDDIIAFIRAEFDARDLSAKRPEWRLAPARSVSSPAAARCRAASSRTAARPAARFSCSRFKAKPTTRPSRTCRMPGAGIGAAARVLDLLHANAVTDLVLAGGVRRPSLVGTAAGLARRQILRPGRLSRARR